MVEYNDLKKLEQNLDSLCQCIEDGQLDIHKAFNKEFMSKYTEFECLESFLGAGGFTFDIESIPEDALDQYVASQTNFDDWQGMLDAAVAEFIESTFSI